MTNAEKIRHMTDEEIAEWLCTETGCCNCKYLFSNKCKDGKNPWLDWLKREKWHFTYEEIRKEEVEDES